MHHLQLFIYHAFMHALHCMCVLHHQFRSKQQWAYAYALWRAAGRQATSYILPLPSPLIKPISLTTTTTTRTHTHTTASTHARTHQCLPPCISSLLRAIASFVPGSTVALSYLLFFTPSLSLSFLPSYASSPLPSLRYVPAATATRSGTHASVYVNHRPGRSHKYMAA